MKAIAYVEHGPPEVLKLVEAARPEPGPGEILVKNQATSVHKTDCDARRGMRRGPLRGPLPAIPGLDFTGTVAGIGPGVQGFREGEPVMGTLAPGRNGASAEYVVASALSVVRRPKGLSPELAAAIPFAGLTALHAVRDLMALEGGERVLIHGGHTGIGLAAVQFTRNAGARVAASGGMNSAELLRAAGAHATIDRDEDPLAYGQFDVVLDLLDELPIRRTLRALRGGGLRIFPQANWRFVASSAIQGIYGRRSRFLSMRPTKADLAHLLQLHREGVFRPRVGRVYVLHGLAQAHRHDESGEVDGQLVVRIA